MKDQEEYCSKSSFITILNFVYNSEYLVQKQKQKRAKQQIII